MYKKKSKNSEAKIQQEKKVKVNPFQVFTDNRPETIVQRKLQDLISSDQETKKPIQKKQNAMGLPDRLKSGIESLSGYTMDDTKVHYNSDKPKQLHAHAYAQGTNIYLGSGQEKHLPHEAWHVVQQKQGRVKPTKQLKANIAINDNEQLEKEADVMGMKANEQGSKETSITDSSQNTNQNLSALPSQLKSFTVIQLNEGLSEKKTIDETADAIIEHKDSEQTLESWYLNNYGNIMHLANTALKKHNIPEAKLEGKRMHGPGATFNFRTWTIEINWNLKDEIWKFSDLASLMYHESRHAEQFFRMIKNKLRSGMRPEKVCDFFGMDKSLIELVIKKAEEQLPKQDESSAKDTVPELDKEAEIWEESIMGKDSEKRTLLLNRWQYLEYLKSRITILENFRESVLLQFDTTVNSTKPTDEIEKYCTAYLKATSTYLRTMSTWIEESLDLILANKYPDFGKEPTLEAQYTEFTIEQFMGKYAMYLAYHKLNSEFQGLKMEFSMGERAKILLSKSTNEHLNADIKDYTELPEEIDAYATQHKLIAVIDQK